MWSVKARFDGRRAVVTGGASGMGAAAAEALVGLGAAVTVLDVKPPTSSTVEYRQVDLRSRASIDDVVGSLDEPTDTLINCAGMPQTFPYRDVLACNIAGLRHLTESLIPTMPAGSSVVNVSSIAGRQWRKFRDALSPLLATEGMDEALDWIDAHPDLGDPYVASKMAVNLYTLNRAPQVAAAGIRINAICPGNTTTAMSADFEKVSAAGVLDQMSSVAGRSATPEDQADVIVFLASDLARYVNGVLLDVDGGFCAAAETRQLARPGN
ncbi:coniferyl-alcohol dehydrogenase [Antrihabitans stalactiti]|uniref:SDR family oxidoreductase n=1 Tax=Antrihabitans stalactiti TaxID=2584121 RepID=A0A848KEI8_9NOCA|nr:coniferyl-alcohol dehydrogenase [Antrihabitans stalactiti]NMN96719.1 SDR family oxidoreductase [Antrihabitans stalactiti]